MKRTQRGLRCREGDLVCGAGRFLGASLHSLPLEFLTQGSKQGQAWLLLFTVEGVSGVLMPFAHGVH